MNVDIPIPVIEVLAFGAVVLLVLVIAELLTASWRRYEDEVLKGTEMSLDMLYLNIPAQQLLYVAILLFVLFTGIVKPKSFSFRNLAVKESTLPKYTIFFLMLR